MKRKQVNQFTAIPMPERFWSKLDQSGGEKSCWVWKGACDSWGYGHFGWQGRMIKAHRFAWQQINGSIPESMKVLHSCDNPPCCNPDHLFLGTHDDNMRDMINKGRDVRVRGAGIGTSKLTEVQVIEIRRLYSQGNTSQRKLARQFGISQGQVWNIVNRNQWRER